MSRIIKFRAWDKENKKMDCPVYFNNLEIWILNEECETEIIGDREEWQETILQTCPLMQYTGLKDKDGKEIYEGDILQYTDIKSASIREIVEWKVQMWTEEGFMTGFGEWWGTADQYKIIGNIYENPELLSGEVDK